MEILILGGTAFLGRAIANEAVARGHDVTCLARGTAPAPERAAFVAADRDEEDGLAAVSGREWVAVIDVSRQPGQVRRAVRDLDTRHWVFVSTGNVYAAFDRPEQSEDAALLDPLDGDVMESMEAYGPAKVTCEQLVSEAPSSATIVRPGLIGGPGDASGRTGYWPWRFAAPTGDDVIAPDDLDFPVALIDVRDLAKWLVTAAEQRIDGVFNATGPATTLGEVLETSKQVAHSTAALRLVPLDRIAQLGIGQWMGPKSMPLWIADPEWRWFGTMDTGRARAAGLVTRPLADTLADTLDYERTRDVARQAGLTDDEEREVRSALDAER
ncbi:NAD-dependent epimerase/dehydratase family protein [Microbacterium sp. KUDC0406]|uniref:NAD-dependent epimerase/dehydratase family protein n=1 Tax=Microbacterium sp. KUDC0406 TaxID=2909588 RepID=UPI001F2E4F47|nr:NAD-dependent epimerase/dehydratase family protein [Microbacterium sp. KUDC0406]UJP09062.1 NAD-dependent epimerase/dehydratase family protein [Microbacterium sp. KUDC0406]